MWRCTKPDFIMELLELLESGEDIDSVISFLKYRKKDLSIPSWTCLKKEYEPKEHRIVVDKEFWPDKGTKKAPKPVPRITFGMQKLAVRRMTQMAFSIPVQRIYYTGKDTVLKEIEKSMEKIYTCCRINTVNIQRMRKYFASCEIATVWYAVEGNKEHNKYGFPTKYKLRCKTYSPMEGYSLYPFLDEYDDMLGMGFAYKKSEYSQSVSHEVDYFEFFTDDTHYIYKLSSGGWVCTGKEHIKIVKIPLGYLWRSSAIWEDQTSNNDEIELALSRESRILDKNSAPYVMVSGKLIKKNQSEQASVQRISKFRDEDDGDGRRILNVENGGNISYVTWQQSVEAMKFFISELKKNIEEELQLPNMSMENVKGLGAISGEARKTLLTDGHLKVGDEQGNIIEFLDRECNVIKAFLGFMNPQWKNAIDSLEVEHVITPFVLNDEEAKINKINKATGGVSVSSRKTGIKMLGWVKDIDEELKNIEEEEEREKNLRSYEDVFIGAE